MRRILLLDDEIGVLRALQRELRQCFSPDEVEIELFMNAEQALLRSGEADFDVVISDYRMPEMHGIDFLKMIKSIQPDAVRLVLSGSTEFDTVVQALNQAEVFRYIPKPWEKRSLVDTVEAAFARRDRLTEERRLADEIRAARSTLSLQEQEVQRLEAEEPGITHVQWGPDGSVLLDPD